MRISKVILYSFYATLGAVFTALLALDCLARIDAGKPHPLPGITVLMVHGVISAIILSYAVYFWQRGSLNKRIAWVVFTLGLESWFWYTYIRLPEILLFNCASWFVMWLSIPFKASGRLSERIFLSMYFAKGFSTALAMRGIFSASWLLPECSFIGVLLLLLFFLRFIELFSLAAIAVLDERREKTEANKAEGQ